MSKYSNPKFEKQRGFLLAVRALEIKHGVYLNTSEWFYLSDRKPDDYSGDRLSQDSLFSAADGTEEEILELIKESQENEKA